KPLVHRPVAVVVDPVADLRRRRAGRAGPGGPVDAVVDGPRAGADAARRGPKPPVHRPVAVVVDPVADLRRRRAGRAGLQDAARAVVHGPGAGAEAAGRGPEPLVHPAVTVVVPPVAHFGRARVDRRVVIVAVHAGRIAVVIEVLAGVPDAVAVGVFLPRIREIRTVVTDIAADVVVGVCLQDAGLQ